MTTELKGCVFNIQKYSVHDGPGIRSIVFLKGCPLHCKWCCNPESQLSQPQIAYNIEKCIGEVCMLCGKVCPQHNIALMDTNKVWINHQNCIHCLACAKACPAKAINIYGEYRTVDSIMNEVEEDALFYSRSEGGLTLSGGEPTMQTEFALALLKESKRRGIPTAIETCGAIPWEVCKEIYDYLDYIHFDIKHIDSVKHKEWTGQGNEQILDTFKKMREAHPDTPCVVRTPIIPGFNDTEETIAAIRDLSKQYPNTAYEVLRYHRYGTTKYTFTGREYELGEEDLDADVFKHLKEISEQ